MSKLDLNKTSYLLDGLTEQDLPKQIIEAINSFRTTENLYSSAAREITTKLENLNDEFRFVKDRNPIHIITDRVKSPRSIFRKLSQRGFEISVESARKNLTDIAGVRVICSYIDDVYLIADLLTAQNDIAVLRRSDYIKEPKPNGYRSLHLIVTVPVFLSEGAELVKVEIQIRTIAMDLWASLEHELSYRLASGKKESIAKELKDCADIISNIDLRMQNIYNITKV